MITDVVDKFVDYEQFVKTTTVHKDDIYPILGLAGETGEFVELVKKAWRSSGENWAYEFPRDKAISELGDILWYITRISHVLDISLEDVATKNVEKLTERRANAILNAERQGSN